MKIMNSQSDTMVSMKMCDSLHNSFRILSPSIVHVYIHACWEPVRGSFVVDYFVLKVGLNRASQRITETNVFTFFDNGYLSQS